MASGTAPSSASREEELDLGSDRSGLVVRGAVAGACAGAVVGLADGVTALLAGDELVTAADLPAVQAFYAAVFLVAGALAAIPARWFLWPRRALSLLVGVGSMLFFAGAWLNVHQLPSFTAAISILADAVLLVLGVLLFRRAYYGPGEDELRVGRWLAGGVLAAILGAGAAQALPLRDAGPAPAAAHREGAPRPNVLLYVVDTLRADHLGAYGYAKPTSPEIDAFAKDAVLFEDCLAPSSWTKPTMASILTSLYPTAHGCVEQRQVLAPEAETLGEVLEAAGWRTAAFSDNPFISPEFGLGQGFSEFDYVRPSVAANGTLLGKALFMTKLLSLVGRPFGVGAHADRGWRVLHRGTEEEPGGLLEFVARADDRPWFAWVQAMEPHLPYDPPPELARAFGFPEGEDYAAPPSYGGVLPFQIAPEPSESLREKLRAQYDGEIRDISRGFGELIERLRSSGQLENTIVVLCADHGEEFHERGGWTHGHSLHREVVHVPLVVRLPDSLGASAAASRGRFVKGRASLLDIFPTVLDACGVTFRPAAGPGPGGWSLMPYLAAEEGKRPFPAVRADRALVSEVTMGPVRLRGIRDGRWFLVEASQPLQSEEFLYDAVSDRAEMRPKSKESELDTLLELRRKLDDVFDALEKVALGSRSRELDAETRAAIESIGYLGGR